MGWNLIKRELALKIVELYYDYSTAIKAEKHFDNIVVGKGVPDDIPKYFVDSELLIVNVIYDSGLLKSKSEARRMIKQGAVKLNDVPITDIQDTVRPGEERILKIGKRRFLKLV